MNCQKCGAVLPENAEFCSTCGNKTKELAATNVTPSQNEGLLEWHFEKIKKFRWWEYKKILTDVTLTNQILSITVKTSKFLSRNLSERNSQRAMSDISQVQTKASVDFWPLLFASISLFAGLLCLLGYQEILIGIIWLVIAWSFFDDGYGQRITIIWKDNSRTTILARDKANAAKFVSTLTKQ